MDSADNPDDKTTQKHSSICLTDRMQSETQVQDSSSKDGPQAIAGQEDGAGVCHFFLLGKCRFGNECRLSHSTPTLDDPEAVVDQENRKDEGKDRISKKRNGKGNKSSLSEDKGSTKKPRMRTADEVISRVLWDASVEPADFVVGYLDRFLGVLERPFLDFNWDTDPSDCDFTSELALPRHRIQYFTYKGRRVWDRNSRTDRVFGSTGQGLAPPFGQEEKEPELGSVTQDVEHDESTVEPDDSKTKQEEESDESLTKPDAENEHLKEGNLSQTTDQTPEFTGSGTGSSLNLQEAGGQPKPTNEEAVNDLGLEVLADQLSLSQPDGPSQAEEGTKEEEWLDWWTGGQAVALGPCRPLEQKPGGRPPKRRPTHFITFRANTPSILSAYQHIERELTTLIPSSAPHWVPASTLHVTLCLLVLPGPEEVTAAGEVLERFAYLDRNPPLTVKFPLKLKHFAGRVLYLSPQPQVRLQELNAGLQEAFREKGWLHRASFSPRYHLTLAKVRVEEVERVFGGVGELKVGKGVNFGRLPINTLHLCRMGMGEDGFYDTICSVNLW